MARTTQASIANIQPLATSFRRHLRAGNRSPKTITAYLEAVDQLDDYLGNRGMPQDVASIRREHVEAYIEDQLSRFRATTALVRFKSLQQFFRWLEEEGEITASPMARMKPPKTQANPPAVLSVDEVNRLLKACSGLTFEARRDAAIVTLFYDTGLRLSELVTLKLSWEVEGSGMGSRPSSAMGSVDLDEQIVCVLGKGNRFRGVPVGAKTVKALDRYLRARAQHPDAALPDLWLGKRGRMTQSGIQQMLRRRATDAGLPHLNPHQFRHTFAHNWLATGGAETDLLMLTGWQSRSMLERYAASTRAERARSAHRKLSPADRL